MMDRVCDGYGLLPCYVLLLMLIAETYITISIRLFLEQLRDRSSIGVVVSIVYLVVGVCLLLRE